AAITFWVLTCTVFVLGIYLVFTKNMVHGALALMMILLCSAGLFLLTGAEFIALSLIVVYVGGILVLLLFFIFYLGKNSSTGEDKPFRKQAPSLVLMSVWLLLLSFYLGRLFELNHFKLPALSTYTQTPEVQPALSNPLQLGQVLFSEYVFEFELIGFLLLIVLVVVAWLSAHLMSKEKK
ncbi:MAG TPA: NADH-quinone oxidoreductase subunit J, partial [Cytophagaceae bacterium]|nr:NADH-quinone oxidoreductase subunit J [Cytophagaceae bacterium]